MNIVPKLQEGGNISSLFTTYRPVQTPQVQAPQSVKLSNSDKESLSIKSSSKDEDKEDTKGKLTEKDLFNMIKDVDGLPNEMKSIITNLKRTLATESLVGADTGELANTYLSSLYKLKLANQNKKRFDESIKEAKDNGSLGEAAITLSGKLLTTDKNGNIMKISLEQYQENPKSYQLLTNSNLAWFRKYDSRTAFSKNDEFFEIISNGMGYESFQKLLQQATIALGNYKYEEQGAIEKKALAGLQALQGKSEEEKEKIISSITGNNVKYTLTQDSNEENIKTLITYLSRALPERSRVWAALKTGKPEQEAIVSLVGNYLMGNMKQTKSIKIDIPSEGKDGKKSGDSSDLDKMQLNTSQRFLNGLGVQSTYVLNPGTNRAVQVVANTMPLTDAEGKPIGTNSTLQDAVSGEYAGILDTTHATIGGHTINSAAFGSIILSDGKISSIDYPCTIKNNGEIIPNTSPKVIKAKQEAEQLLRSKGVDVRKPEDIKKYWRAINAAYKKYGLSDAYNDQGEPTGSWRRFGVVNVTASDKVLGMDEMDDNPLLKEVTNDSVIDNLIQITKDNEFNKKGFFNSLTGSYNRFYEGTLWIPLDVNYHASTTSKMTVSEARSLEEAQQARDVRANWKPAHQI